MRHLVAVLLFLGCLFSSHTLQADEGAVIPPNKTAIKDPVKVPPPPAPAADTTPAVAASLLIANVDQFPVIYAHLLEKKGYRPGLGHTVAAATMVNCLPNLTAVEKAEYLDKVIVNLDAGKEDNFRRRLVWTEVEQVGNIRNSGQAARLAAILLCKIGERTIEQMFLDFDGAIAEVDTRMEKVTGKRMLPAFYQLIAVAALMN